MDGAAYTILQQLPVLQLIGRQRSLRSTSLVGLFPVENVKDMVVEEWDCWASGNLVMMRSCTFSTCKKPSQPLNGYAQELQETFRLVISKQLISRWFSTIGPFKGTMRVTSSFTWGRNKWSTYRFLCHYLDFMESIEYHTRLVFADEIPMKQISIYQCVKRDVWTGTTTHHTMNANSKNGYSILTAINVKVWGLWNLLFLSSVWILLCWCSMLVFYSRKVRYPEAIFLLWITVPFIWMEAI